MVLAVLKWEATGKETFSALGIKNANYKIIAIIALLIFQDFYLLKVGKRNRSCERIVL